MPERARRKGWKYGHLTIRRAEGGKRLLEALLLNLDNGSAEIASTPIIDGGSKFSSVTSAIPAAHWAEQAVGDLWGLHASGHPRWKSLILHEAWPPDKFPFAVSADGPPSPRESKFLTVGGQGVHEIPVGPIHAGIIEPGHFRFSCIGEIVANLDIRLGYVHRGVEARLAAVPLRHARHVAESASSDSAVANALAHAQALEDLWGLEGPKRAAAVRTVALEIERVANHFGDLGALASDIGFALGAATFGRLRGAALGFGQTLSGTRFQRGFVCPGGLAWEVGDAQLRLLTQSLSELKPAAADACEILFENPGVQERLEGVGILKPSLADEFGMVGPTARASGSPYDARCHFAHALFPGLAVDVATETAGDAFARAEVRRKEVFSSLRLIEEVLAALPQGGSLVKTPETLPPSKTAIGIVEAWRGELIHWITTDEQGKISRYAIRDPSFQNWTGVAIAVRGNLVMDFPLINKSFNLSYSGSDL
ncbi:MAG: NADH-quinone oxidoreductase subunit C [Fimbriimonas ginsengisoli]|uniref:NADH-quinone oxidoreductase subunit C n=1 Tax=Fimbriimonas ginsengisoli TaxID=1005039 RepID=A0A931PTM6_FIMGI|nr:NADH-quinone oxidoreductase subunit C [Fimbriimonas ginsengisoli]